MVELDQCNHSQSKPIRAPGYAHLSSYDPDLEKIRAVRAAKYLSKLATNPVCLLRIGYDSQDIQYNREILPSLLEKGVKFIAGIEFEEEMMPCLRFVHRPGEYEQELTSFDYQETEELLKLPKFQPIRL